MGSSLSTEASAKQREEAIRREHGVLIPPSIVAIDSTSLPISCQSRLHKVTSPNILNDLWTMNQGRQLLESYMTPGVTLEVPTATGGQILVSLNTTNSIPSSFLWAEQPISDTAKLELLVPTADSPNLQLGLKKNINQNSSMTLKGQMNTNQQGWIEGRGKSSYQGIGMLLSLSSSFPPNDDSAKARQSIPNNIQLQAAAEYEQSLIAIHGNLDENQLPRLQSSMASFNLNHYPANTDNSDPNSQVPPPLWLTLKQTNSPSEPNSTNWVLNLSQILTFDRNVWNILEERAPKVRQTLGWSLQMETSSSSANSSDTPPETKWSLGTTWQFNRGTALKGVVSSSNSSPLLLKYGMLVKRWQQPRVTLSILNQFDFIKGKHSFLGFGVELQASPLLLSSTSSSTISPAYPNEPPADYAVADGAAPTKIHIPKQL